ncbi:hypothetical protein ACP70R_036293 [Stipagrostis hirtigluma subsp. patula]
MPTSAHHRAAHMAPVVQDDATVRGMEEGGHAAVALGYPLLVGDGRQAPLGYPPANAPSPRRVRDSPPPPPPPLNCSPCNKFATASSALFGLY